MRTPYFVEPTAVIYVEKFSDQEKIMPKAKLSTTNISMANISLYLP